MEEFRSIAPESCFSVQYTPIKDVESILIWQGYRACPLINHTLEKS